MESFEICDEWWPAAKHCSFAGYLWHMQSR
jgi:hypothetical protein